MLLAHISWVPSALGALYGSSHGIFTATKGEIVVSPHIRVRKLGCREEVGELASCSISSTELGFELRSV